LAADAHQEALAYPTQPDEGAAAHGSGETAVPLHVQTRTGCLSFIGATTVFGSPLDVTLEEIALAVMHLADDSPSGLCARTAQASSAFGRPLIERRFIDPDLMEV
jgi:hypothetical protein